MKKFLPYLVLIGILAVAAIWLLVNRNAGSFSKIEDAFAVNDRKSVSKIVLTDTEHKKVELALTNGNWMVNGKYGARPELVQSLLDVVSRIKTQSPVPKAAHDYVLKNMMEKNIKVQVFVDNDQQPVRTYYVGGSTADSKGTYMILEGDGKMAQEQYITYLPGLPGYLTPRFNTDEENWRTRELFKYKDDDIKSLSVEYPGDESKSFTLNRASKDSFVLSPLDEKFVIHQAYQQRYIPEYVHFYSSIFIENFDNSNPDKDSIVQTTPYCIFTITGSDNSVNKAKLFYMPLNKRSKMIVDDKGEPMTRDVDHYYATIHDGKDFAIVQYYVFGKLLRSYKDFFFKPGKPGT